MQTTIVALGSPFFWAAMLLMLGLIALLTYLYSGKNIKLMLLFTFFSFVTIVLATTYDSWNLYLQNHFLGRFDAQGIPYRVSRPGWWGLLDAWPLWIIPAILLAGLIKLGTWGIQIMFRQQLQAPPLHADIKTAPSHQLEMDRLKSELAQALAEKNDANVEIETLRIQLQQRTTSTHTEAMLADQIKILELERDAQLLETQELTQQLALQTEALSKLKRLIEKPVKK